MFVNLALASAAMTIVSGGKHLLAVDGVAGLTVMQPAALADALKRR